MNWTEQIGLDKVNQNLPNDQMDQIRLKWTRLDGKGLNGPKQRQFNTSLLIKAAPNSHHHKRFAYFLNMNSFMIKLMLLLMNSISVWYWISVIEFKTYKLEL